MRVPLEDFALVSRALDFGAEAIIAPMINSAADANASPASPSFRRPASACGPQRAMTLQGRTTPIDYLREANEGTLTLAMIETPTALANVDAIAATPGIDALFIGPYDLSTSLERRQGARCAGAGSRKGHRQDLRRSCEGRQLPGIYCTSAERARALAKRGFKFITVASDTGLLRDGAAAMLKALKT